MKRFQSLIPFLLLLLSPLALRASDLPRFLRQPSLSPSGDTVYFVHADAIWRASTKGGLATVAVSMPGICATPKVSPDGRWLAFVSNADGNPNLYVVGTSGGSVRQLTYTDANKEVDSWGWDSETIYFTSGAQNLFSAFRVSRLGGAPRYALGSAFYSHTHGAVELPQNEGLYFGTSWESARFPTRKGYRGENCPAIECYNAKENRVTRVTDGKSQALWPVVDANGKLYFVGDRDQREYGLYVWEQGQARKLAAFEESIYAPSISADGSTIAFEKGYQIHIYNTRNGQVILCPIQLPDFSGGLVAIAREIGNSITDFDLSPDGKKLALVSRGRAFIASADGRHVRELTTPADERIGEIRWLANSREVIYTRTARGWSNIFTQPADGRGTEKRLTRVEKQQNNIAPNDARTQLAYISGNRELRLLDVASGADRLAVESEFWFFTDRPTFSASGEQLLFTAYRNFEAEVFIFDIPTGKEHRLTRNGTPEFTPVWGPKGETVYFAANRHEPSFPQGVGTSELYRLPLRREVKPLPQEAFDRLFTEQNAPPKEESKKGKKQSAKTTVTPTFSIDTTLLWRRWEPVNVPKSRIAGDLHRVGWGDDWKLFFRSGLSYGNMGIAYLKEEADGSTRVTNLAEGRLSRVASAEGQVMLLSGGRIQRVDFNANRLQPIEINHRFETELQAEFRQMFYENWAIIAHTFYDSSFHGVDWEGVLRKYERYVPGIRTRSELSVLQNDMLGELNASHLGFSSWGKEAQPYFARKAYSVGLEFHEEDPFVVSGIIPGGPLDLTDSPIVAGARLVAVNGTNVTPSMHRDSLFYGAVIPEQVNLEFQLPNGKRVKQSCHPISYNRHRELRYQSWTLSRRAIVDSLTEGRIGYVHMYNMDWASFDRFVIEMTGPNLLKEGLIIDLRHNRGGNVHDNVLTFLQKRPYMLWRARGGSMERQPNFAPSAVPIVMLIDRESLSDAEVTSQGFKELGLGTLMGTSTYRWIIFTGSFSFLDGSSTRIPSWGCFDLKGRDLEMTGVEPDIYVPMSADDYFHDRDPQLKAAIEFLLKKGK